MHDFGKSAVSELARQIELCPFLRLETSKTSHTQYKKGLCLSFGLVSSKYYMHISNSSKSSLGSLLIPFCY